MTTMFYELTTEEVNRIREFIAKTKQKYLNAPTYIEVDWDDDLCELAEKRWHCDWWHELNGDSNFDYFFECPDTYYNVIEKKLVEILAERPEELDDPWESAAQCLASSLVAFAISGAEPLSESDLYSECFDQLRRYVNSLEGADLEQAFLEWLYCLDATGDASDYIDVDDRALQVPIEFVLDRLENCEDTLDVDWDDLGLSKTSTYADAVSLARKEF